MGKPMANTEIQIVSVFPSDLRRRGSLHAACQFSSPQVRELPKNSGDVLKLLMRRKTTGKMRKNPRPRIATAMMRVLFRLSTSPTRWMYARARACSVARPSLAVRPANVWLSRLDQLAPHARLPFCRFWCLGDELRRG